MYHFDWLARNGIARQLDAIIRSDANYAYALEHADPDNRARLTFYENMRKHVDAFEAAGRIVVEISPEMQTVFGDLDLTPVRRDEVVLPHDSVYIDLPGGSHHLWSCGERFPIRGMYVTRSQRVGDTPRTIYRGDLIPGECWMIYAWGHKGHETDDTFFTCPILLDHTPKGVDGSNLETQLESYMALTTEDTPESIRTPNQREDDRKTLRWAVRVAVNAFLYWLSPEAAIDVDHSADAKVKKLEAELARAKSPGKKKEIRRTLDRTSKVKVVRFRIAPATPPEGHDLRSPVRRHKVGAHWHHFWVGPTHAMWDDAREVHDVDGVPRQRIRRLVLEFWRGEPSSGRIVSRVHKIA